MDAVDVIGDRIVEMAKENAAVEADAVKKAEWERIADCFTKNSA